MQIQRLQIVNFRAIEEVDIEFSARVNVIVGPNAIGKTTLLEALRATKALTSARTPNEAGQTLFSLGASSPHAPQLLNTGAITRDPTRPATLRVTYRLSQEELEWIKSNISQISRGIVQARHGQAFASQTTLLTYLASSAGLAELKSVSEDVSRALSELQSQGGTCGVKLSFSSVTGIDVLEGGLAAALVAALDQRHPPSKTCFSYFPADRALPQGEQPIQIGIADAQNQLESHNSQPQLKYARLKNALFGATLMPEDGDIKADFEEIYSGILKGRRLVGFGVSHVGLISIRVEDTETGKQFDIDAMSSGEKGLILTSLLIKRSLVNHGVVLIDEPELHLNPAVCKDLLNFFIESYAKRKDLQFIVCSHSPEILSSAIDHPECTLYHLASERLLTKVRTHDQDVIAEALRHLGTSEGEGLLFRGTIFVEGPDDVAILEAGFGETIRRYKPRDLGGRAEIEKQIGLLQKAEANGREMSLRAFIFDRDDAPTTLQSTSRVRILQWSRRCFENYLIDLDILADICMDADYVKNKVGSIGELQNLLRQLAAKQLDEIAARSVYQRMNYESPGLRREDVRGATLEQVASNLYARIEKVKAQLSSLEKSSWIQTFLADVMAERAKLTETWDLKWIQDCDGKRLFADLHNHVQPKHGGARYMKIRVVQEMRVRGTDAWRALKQQLEELLKPD